MLLTIIYIYIYQLCSHYLFWVKNISLRIVIFFFFLLVDNVQVLVYVGVGKGNEKCWEMLTGDNGNLIYSDNLSCLNS